MDDATRDDIRQRFLKLPTAVVSDVFDELGVLPPALTTDVRRVTNPVARLAGWAYTVTGEFAPSEGADRLKLEIIDGLPAGSVAVWNGTNARGICLFGDLIAATMQKRGCVGAYVEGGIRDVEVISETGFPVFARYVTPVQSIGRWRVTSHDTPLSLPGVFGNLVTVATGDFILGDEDGVMVIPAGLVVEVLERTEEIVRMETEARDRSASGMSATEMLDEFGHV